MVTRVKASRELFSEVIEKGLCTLCGACAGSCPYLVSYKGRIVLLDNCKLSEGECYQHCPRTFTDMDAISQQVFGVPYSADELGTVREVLMARSTDAQVRAKAQYGGTVTTLLSLALAEGLIDAAVLTKTANDKTPRPFLARNAEEVRQGTGSSYMACSVLEALNSAKDEKGNLGVVAMPCQVLALAKMKDEPPENRLNVGNVTLSIGLFCTWALSPDSFHKFLKENLDLPEVIKFDIPPPPANRLDAYTKSGKISFPLDQVRKFVMPSCAYCADMTSEFADISVGSVEGIEGWNTVVVRSEAGAELIEMARAKGKLETDTLPAQNLAHLKEAALLKKKRALREIIKRSGDRRNTLYLGLSDSIVDRLLESGGGGK